MKAPKAKTSDALETLPMWRARQVSHGAHDVRVVRVGVVVVEAHQAESPKRAFMSASSSTLLALLAVSGVVLIERRRG
jgi:hypothetical protein